MDFESRISAIRNYFQGMNVVPGGDKGFVTYIKVAFPKKWVVSVNDLQDIYNITITKTEDNTGYYFWSDDSSMQSNIFDAIDECIRVNEEAEARATLLITKIKELQAIFADETYDLKTLESLEFKMKSKKRPAKKDEDVDTEPESETINTSEETTE